MMALAMPGWLRTRVDALWDKADELLDQPGTQEEREHNAALATQAQRFALCIEQEWDVD